MDERSGVSKEEEVISEGIGESSSLPLHRSDNSRIYRQLCPSS